MIIGVCGVAGAGKDEVAAHLVRHYGFTRYGLADPVKEAIYTLNPHISNQTTVKNAVDTLGWDAAKRAYPEVRRLLQVMGTEVGRRIFGEEVWTGLFEDWAMASSDENIVVPDVRFKNEADYFTPSRYGERRLLIRVTRPGVGPVNGHASDNQDLSAYVTHEIVNDGSLEELYEKVNKIMAEMEVQGSVQGD